MIEPASLVGFALVLIATTWAISALLAGALLGWRRRLRHMGPRAERRAAAIALIAPAALGVLVTAGLVGFSLVGPSLGFADHCLDHGHHLHLCVRHGSAGLGAIALVAALAGLFAARLGRAIAGWCSARRSLRAVRAVSTEREIDGGATVMCAPSRQPFCFTAGPWTPRIYVGSATFDRLGASEQAAMIAHERAHVAFGDLWRGGLLSLLAGCGAPVLAQRARQVWHDATERLCDRAAADAVGSPEAVASAILAFARAPACSVGLAFVPRADQVVDRVEAVLGDGPRGDEVARRLGVTSALALLSSGIAAVLLVDPLHHAFETLLGSL